jgi:uncharacterized protein (DUF4415 family)
MKKKPDPELIDDENPELTDEWFASARPAREVLPEIFGMEAATELLKPKTKRPPAKKLLSIRYSTEVVDYFRHTGPGWQTRMDEVLKAWIAAHPVGP